MKTNKTIYLDMDGVIVDFVGGLHRGLGLPYNYAEYPYTLGKYEMFGEAVARTEGNHTMDSLMRICFMAPFWSNLGWALHGSDVLKIVESFSDEVYIASYPMDHPDAWLGKLWWIEKYMPAYKKRTILMTAHKQLLAKKDTILVDDRDDNVDKFIAAGGDAYLIPQPWNSKHKLYRSDWLADFDKWMKSKCTTTSS